MAFDHTNDDVLICYGLLFVTCVAIRSSSVFAGGSLSFFFFVFTPYCSTSSAVCVLSIRSGQRITLVQMGYLSFSLRISLSPLYFCCSFSLSHHHLIVVDCLVYVHFKCLPLTLSRNLVVRFPVGRTWAPSVRGCSWINLSGTY